VVTVVQVAGSASEHSYLNCGHTDAQAVLCRMQRIARTHSLTIKCGNFFYKNPKMEISHNIEFGMNKNL
jgi:hypothetical protein